MKFSKGDIPSDLQFNSYKKKPLTRMARIDGAFEVETREGLISCEDGWLAIDSGGYPYPIADEEQKAIYELAGEE